MPKELFDLVKQQHKFGAQLETLLPKSKTGYELEEVKRRVSSILISAGTPCRVSTVEEDYKSLFGEEFPVYELGCSNPLEVLEKISEVCEVSEDGSNDPYISVKPTGKNVHIFNLVRKNKKPTPRIATVKEVFVPFSVQDSIRRILFENKCIRLNEFYRKLENEFDFQYMNLDNIDPLIVLRSLPHILCYDRGIVKSVKEIGKCEVGIPEQVHFHDEHVIPSYRLSKIEHDIAMNICCLINEHEYLAVGDIPALYVKKYGKELNWFRLGFYDLWTFLTLMPGKITLFMDDGRQFAKKYSDDFDVVNLKISNPSKYCGQEVYKQVLKKVKKLVMSVVKGLNAKYLMSSYETMYFEKLVLRKNLLSFILELQELNVVRIEEIGKDIILLPSNGPDKLDKEMIPKEVMKFKKREYPMDVLRPGVTLKSFNFTEEIKPTLPMFCAAHVSHTNNPNDFNLRLIGLGENNNCELGYEFVEMLIDMENLYLECSEEYKIPKELLRIGMVCAACVSGSWQRAKIIDVCDSLVMVKLLDVGTSQEVTLDNLKFLHRRFAELPISNLRASLYNIKPIGLDWSVSAIIKFGHLILENYNTTKALSVVIMERSDKDVYQVVLTDVHPSMEIHIGDELVKCGYAEFKQTAEK